MTGQTESSPKKVVMSNIQKEKQFLWREYLCRPSDGVQMRHSLRHAVFSESDTTHSQDL